MIVYLAGPIAGLTYDDANDWREYAGKVLSPATVLSPLRHRNMMTTDRRITERDRFDVQRCDLMLVNLVGATKVSIGTMIELGWADAWRKPIVGAMGVRNVHTHEMVRELIGFRAFDLDGALDLARQVLGLK